MTAVNVEVSIRALITVPPDDVRFAAAIPGEPIANWQICSVVQIRTDWIALARLAIWRISWLLQSQGIAEEGRFAAFAVEPVGIVDASEALSGDDIAIANSIGIHVVIALALLTGTYGACQLTSWVSVESILAFLAS